MMLRGRRPMTCYHEAGHCLARWYIGRHFDFARVLTVEEVRAGVTIPNRRGDPVGQAEGLMTSYDLLSPWVTPASLDGMGGEPILVAWMRMQTLAAVEAELMELAAATWAEARYRKCSTGGVALTGAEDDGRKARHILDTWHPDPAERQRAARLADRRASALVRSTAGWAAITAMAMELLATGSLEWATASAMCEAAYGWTWIFRPDLSLPTPAVIRTGSKPPVGLPPPPIPLSAAA